MAKRLLLVGIATIFLAGCYREIEGCLDPFAVNYAVGADKDCCCQYPALQVQVQYVKGGDNYLPGDTLTNDLGQVFTLRKCNFFVSGFRLVRADGAILTTREKIRASRDSAGILSTLELLDNFALLTLGKQNQRIGVGSLPGACELSGVNFRIGLPDSANFLLPSSLSASHPLQVNADSMYVSTASGRRWVSLSVDLYQGGDTTAVLIRTLSEDGSVPLVISEGNTIFEAQPLGLLLKVDVSLLLKNIDLELDSDVTRRQKLIQNIPSACSVTYLD